MSSRSSPVNGGYESASVEPAMRLSVRKDLFPDERLGKISPVLSSDEMLQEGLEDVSCVKLETDFEQSIDDIANQKMQVHNGALPSPIRTRHRKHKQHSRRDAEHSPVNGCLSSQKKRKKRSLREYHERTAKSNSIVTPQVKGGKNLYLVSSSECQNDAEDDEDESNESESSEDEDLEYSVKLPILNIRQSGKPYSHELSQLSTKKSKSKESSKKRTHVVVPCSGKPRSMIGICSSRSKKKSKKYEYTTTYQSQIVDTNTNIKLKIRKTNLHESVPPITPISVADIGQRKSKKKRNATPEVSESSGEEYDPSRGDTAAAMSLAAPKPRQPRQTRQQRQPAPPRPRQRTRTRKLNNNKSKSEKTEKSRVSGEDSKSKETGPQSPWASMPEEILFKIFDYAVASQGSIPTIIRLSRVCKLWNTVSCRPELWRNADLAQYTSEKCKTDYKLVWLLENRLSLCHTLNIAHWKVCNITWVLACVADYCPGLVDLSVAGWSRITPDQLYDLVQGLPSLQRLDLSLTSETGGSSTCLSAASVARLAESFGHRLTHLTLANNKFTALPQILTSVAAHCPNLELLDISGAMATTHPASVPLEALQKGCPKMRVFRAANSQLVLAAATTSQQMEVEGWTCLEELSIAGEAEVERACVGQYRLGDEALARLVRGATRLRLLDLRGLQRLTDSGLVRVPAWDLQHLFLGGCNVTRQSSACLELICEKWSHSLLELDLSWASAARVLNDAVSALTDSPHSKLRILNLCGSAVFLEQVKKVLIKCRHLESLNLSSCRALPRGMKRLYTGKELQDLKDSLDPNKAKKEDSDEDEDTETATKKVTDSKSGVTVKASPKSNISESSGAKAEQKSSDKSSSCVFQEPKSVSNSSVNAQDQRSLSSINIKGSVESSRDVSETITSLLDNKKSRTPTSSLSSPLAQSKPDSSSTPRSESIKMDHGSPHFSPVRKPDSQVPNSPDVHLDSIKSSNSWNLGQFKSTPSHKSEASPLNRLENHNTSKLKHSKIVEQCSPTTSLENKPSPETHNLKPDIKNPNSWNYSGGYSPMTRQDAQFSSQRSPYSAQPSPAQPSPYSTQPSPYSTQPSPYSSQPSPYSAQPSPDTSQMVKPDHQKSGAWNTGNYSPMPKQHTPFSPHPSTHTSPDPGLGVKSDAFRNNCKTPGQYSPMSRQDRLHHSPYSPRPSVEGVYSNKKSPGVGKYSPMMRPECHLPSPDGGHAARSHIGGRTQDMFGRSVSKMSEMVQNIQPPEVPNSWGFGQVNNTATSCIESLVWSGSSFPAEQPMARVDSMSGALHTPPPQQQQQHAPAWPELAAFDTMRRPHEPSEPWTLGEFRVEPPRQSHSYEQAGSAGAGQGGGYELGTHMGQPHMLQSYLDDSYAEASRVD
ncbi:PREDICTED: uncharacterized protein LOC106117258 [Papilio xuthus]|uniref:F-box/LRR-repeat protein 6 n=1 Tax=Papilio xuthus TaxID=66420 RepID=A0A194PIM8_PAPXU|nr:PREDICTED: uncharacterized protein LOC106117258 [Papilio xuthus]KPI93276.1 F-box/LRR-repeat protein 6 [Papilio xuthus]